MDLKDWGWRDWTVALLALGVVAIALAAIGPGLAPTWKWLGENSSNIASWVQAVGSIAAIASGFWLARYQAATTRNQQAFEKLEYDRAQHLKQSLLLIDIYDQGAQCGKKLRGYAETKSVPWKQAGMECKDLLHHIDSLNVTSFVNQIDVAVAVSFRRNVAIFVHWFETAESTPVEDRNFQQLLRMLDSFIDAYIANARRSIEDVRELSNLKELPSVEEYVDLLVTPEIKFPQSTTPSDNGQSQTQQPPAAGQ